MRRASLYMIVYLFRYLLFSLQERRFIDFIQCIVDSVQFYPVHQPMKNDGVPLVSGIERGISALLQQCLSFLLFKPHSKADTEQAVA